MKRFCSHREMFKNRVLSFDIWNELYGDMPREDSAEEDLYRLLIRDPSTGGVIRQNRNTNKPVSY